MLMETGGVYANEFLQPVECSHYLDRFVVLFERLARADPDSVPSQVDLTHYIWLEGLLPQFANRPARRGDLPTSSGPGDPPTAGGGVSDEYLLPVPSRLDLDLHRRDPGLGRAGRPRPWRSTNRRWSTCGQWPCGTPRSSRSSISRRIASIARGELLASLGRWDEAESSFAEGFAVSYSNPRRSTSVRPPGSRPRRLDRRSGSKYSAAWCAPAYYLAITRMKQGRIPEAMAAIRRNVAIREEIAAAKPGDRESLIDVVRTNFKSAVLIAEHWSAQESLAYFDRAVECYGQLAASKPDELFPRKMLGLAYRNRAAALARLGRVEPARRDAEAGLVVRRSLARRPSGPSSLSARPGDRPGRALADRSPGRTEGGGDRRRLGGGRAGPPTGRGLAPRSRGSQPGRPSVLALAEARLDEGRVAEAISLASRAAEWLDRMIPVFSDEYFPRARAQALLATMVDREPGPPMPPDDR